MRFNGRFFTEQPPEFSIDEHDVVTIRFTDGEMALEILCSPNTFFKGQASAKHVTEEWLGRRRDARFIPEDHS